MRNDSGPTDVLIIGGGVIGLAIGWRALAAGLTVRLLEREAATAIRTSHVAAGMIAPVGEASATEPDLLALSLASAQRYPAFVSELEAETGLSTGYRRCGSLFVARDAAEAAVLDREFAFRQSLGHPVSRLLPSAARALEPTLAPTLQLALEIPDDQAIDPRALTAALARAFIRAGGDLRTGTEVSGLSVSHDEVHGARLDNGESLSAGHTVIAAGPWSGEIGGTPAGAQIPFRPVKGQILTLSAPRGAGTLEHMVRMQPGYLVPRGDGRYVLGASVEDRGFDARITAGAVSDLLRDLIALVPAAADWSLDEQHVGFRPATTDSLPVIGASPVLDRLIWATGHHRHGILLTPLTAELVVAEIADQPLPAFAAPASPARFRHLVGRVEVAR